MSINAVIYARYSSDNQREESIEGQLRECKVFADKNDITVLNTYIDRALSAKTDDRPDFQKMIADSEKKLFDVIIVWKLDRFARNRYDSAHYKRLLNKNGVKVVSATEPISNDATGILLESMLEGMAEYYSAELAEKIGRGLTENVLKGKYNGGPITMGYRIDENRNFVIDPLTAPIVLDVFKMYDDGKTMKEIAQTLNNKGITNSRGTPIVNQLIEAMLRNRRYIGEYTHGKTTNYDAIPPIIPRSLFDSIQEKLAKNAKASARYTAKEERYLLTTKLFCGTCERYMAGESGTSRTGNIYRYYKCANAKRGRGCKRKPLKKEVIEDYVIDEIKSFLEDDAMIETITDMLIAAQEAENTTLPLLERELVNTNKAIANILDAIQQGVFTTSTKGRLEELEKQKETLEIGIAQEGIRHDYLTRDQILFWLLRFRQIDTTVYEQRQRLVDTFVNAIYIFDDEISFLFNCKDGTKTISIKELEAAKLKGEVFEREQLISTKLNRWALKFQHPPMFFRGCQMGFINTLADISITSLSTYVKTN